MTPTGTSIAEGAGVDEAQWQALRDEAAGMRGTCSVCGTSGCKVVANFMQATRREPCRFLGFQGVCTNHFLSMAFDIEASQLTL
jgi:hypothetical protein